VKKIARETSPFSQLVTDTTYFYIVARLFNLTLSTQASEPNIYRSSVGSETSITGEPKHSESLPIIGGPQDPRRRRFTSLLSNNAYGYHCFLHPRPQALPDSSCTMQEEVDVGEAMIT